MKALISNFWQILVGIVVGLFGLCWVAFGATYNFYSNNTEQGDHGVANPVVSVTGGRATGSGAQATAASATPGFSAPEPQISVPSSPSPGASETTVAKADLADIEEHHLFHRFKLGAGAMAFPNGHNPGFGDGGVGGILSTGVYFSRDLGLTAFAGATKNSPVFYGGDLELMPIHITVGLLDDMFDAGVLLGVSSLATSNQNAVSGHVGARLDFNLAHNWGLSAVVRGNEAYVMAEAGLTIRL